MNTAMFEDSRQRFLAALRTPEAVQREMLLDILRHHQDTEYGRRLGFRSIDDLATYRARVPVIRYEDVEPYVERMLGGEPDVLLEGQPIFYAQSTGSTGRPKRVGFHPRSIAAYWSFFGPAVASTERAFPGSIEHSVYVVAQYREAESGTGIPIGQASGFVHETFRPHGLFQRVPAAVYETKDYEARYYALLLFALAGPIVCWTTMYPSILLTLFDRAAEHSAALADDLKHGTLRAGPGDLASLAVASSGMLRPDPARAQRLLDIVRVHGQFVPEEFWPELRVIQVWKGGSARHYLAELRRRCPHTVLRPTPSGSTEAALLVGLEPEWAGGVPALQSTVFEFLPEGSKPTPDALVPMTELQEHQGYRLIVTGDRGLYRYAMDDVFTVEGRYQGVPVLAFSHRFETSSVAGEKMTEAHVLRAVEAALARCAGLVISVFEVGPEAAAIPRYAIALELALDASSEALQAFLAAFERELCTVNISYEQYRQSGLLRPPVLYEMKTRHFDGLRRARSITAQRSDAQMKAQVLHTTFVEWDRKAIRTIEFPAG